MNGHVDDWLPAYHDGELHGARLKSVEDHLKDCDGCRRDLDQLRKLSALLQAAPLPERQISARRFASQVELRLKDSPPRPRWEKALKAGWQAAPLGLLFAWGFSQAVLILSSLIAALGGFDQILSGEFSLQVLFLSLPYVFNPGLLVRVAGVLPRLRWEDPFLDLILLQLGLTGLIGVLLWGWLASFWVYQKRRLMTAESGIRI
jgi:predicted anti-sigma-YlaC factor YlaD